MKRVGTSVDPGSQWKKLQRGDFGSREVLRML